MSSGLVELRGDEFSRVAELAETLWFQPFCTAVVSQAVPGRVFVDNAERPTMAFVSREDPWCFLMGGAGDGCWHTALRDGVIGGSMVSTGTLLITCPPIGWDGVLADVFPDRVPVVTPRRHYVCRGSNADWSPLVPEGFETRSMDTALLGVGGPELPDQVRDTLERWQAAASPTFRDYGMVAVDTTVTPERVVSWATVDSVIEGVGDVGVYTLSSHRQRGLATATSGVAVAAGFRAGLTALHWTCNETNAPSIRIAEKLGFVRGADYALYSVYRDAALHKAAQGYALLQAGDAMGARLRLERALDASDRLPPFVAYDAARACARLGDDDGALAHLARAVEFGWRETAETQSCPDFASLLKRPEWTELIQRMQE